MFSLTIFFFQTQSLKWRAACVTRASTVGMRRGARLRQFFNFLVIILIHHQRKQVGCEASSRPWCEREREWSDCNLEPPVHYEIEMAKAVARFFFGIISLRRGRIWVPFRVFVLRYLCIMFATFLVRHFYTLFNNISLI